MVPQVEELDDQVVEEADTEGHEQDLAGRSLGPLAGGQHVGDRGPLGERQLTVQVLDEVPAQGDQQHDPEVSADQAGQEDLQERRLQVEDVERRDGEDRPGHDDAGGLPDGLDDHVFEQGAATGEEGPEKHRQNGDRDRGLDHVAGLQSDVGGGKGEDDHHDDAEDHRPDARPRDGRLSGGTTGV